MRWTPVLVVGFVLSGCGNSEAGRNGDATLASDARADGADAAAGAPGSGGRGGAGGNSKDGGLGGAGGLGSGGGAGGTAGMAACVALDTSGAPEVAITHDDAAAPTPAGGPVSGGTYYLTSIVYHGGTFAGCSFKYREVLEFTASSATEGTLRSTLVAVGISTHPAAFSYTTNGTALDLEWTCASPGSPSEVYTATATQLQFFRPGNSDCGTGATIVLTYARQ